MDSTVTVVAELTAMREVQRFMLSALRAALAWRERTPARQMLLLGLAEHLERWRSERLSVGPLPGLTTEEAAAAHAAFRSTCTEHAQQIEALLGEMAGS